jgi:hypothetical protein
MVIPEYAISIFLYLTYLIVFICCIVFYANLDKDIRSKGGYITAITLSGASFLGFNLYFLFKLISHLQRKG